jgi:hypothetical protein
VELLFGIVLTGVLLAAVVSFVVMGLRQRRRRRRLARDAHAAGLRFAAEDPFDVPRRYRRFALVEAGHGPQAHNVTYGRVHGLPIRAFDFRYEVGHGTRRLTRHYGVVVAETGLRLPSTLLWNRQDLEAAPLVARRCRRPLGPWTCAGQDELVAKLASAAAGFGEKGGSIQTEEGTVMLCAPAARRQRGYARGIEDMVRVLRALRDPEDTPPPADGDGVENAPDA